MYNSPFLSLSNWVNLKTPALEVCLLVTLWVNPAYICARYIYICICICFLSAALMLSTSKDF